LPPTGDVLDGEIVTVAFILTCFVIWLWLTRQIRRMT
jgi:hypothetical protein